MKHGNGTKCIEGNPRVDCPLSAVPWKQYRQSAANDDPMWQCTQRAFLKSRDSTVVPPVSISETPVQCETDPSRASQLNLETSPPTLPANLIARHSTRHLSAELHGISGSQSVNPYIHHSHIGISSGAKICEWQAHLYGGFAG